MTLKTAIRSRFKSQSGVTDIVGSKIDWTVRPQGKNYPALVLQIISDTRPQTFGGFTEFRQTRLQIDCFGNDANETDALKEAAIGAIAGPFVSEGRQFGRAMDIQSIDRGENKDTGFIHHEIIEVMLWHNA